MINATGSFTGVSVDDIDAAREFYVDTLELPLTDDTMGLTLELPGGGQFFIYEKSEHTPATYTVLNFIVESIDATVDHLGEHHGIVFELYDSLPSKQDGKGILRGKTAGMGPDIAWFSDPAGNILAVIEE
jgi:catechol 2,3-dioxygenase-like lactoylglutathione lyase family enzyme